MNTKFNRTLVLISALLSVISILVVSYFLISSIKESNNIKSAIESVVNIKIITSIDASNYKQIDNTNIGSGVIISSEGYIVTNLHVILGQKNIIIEVHNGDVFEGKIVGIDARSDIAIIKINPSNSHELKPIPIVENEPINVGDVVYAIGNPYGIGVTLTRGIISATGRDYGNPYLELIQTDAAVNPGNSGGALINEEGRLIGINSRIYSNTGSYAGISFALPISKVADISSQLIRFGEAKKAWIGDLRVRNRRIVLNNRIQNCLEIIELKQGGPLRSNNNISEGDCIIKINGKEATWQQLTFVLKSAFPGDSVKFEVINKQKKIKKLEVISEPI